MHQVSGLSMEALVKLKSKTRELRTSLMATTVLVDASVATCNEWLSIVTDYVGLQLNHISGKFLDHQLRIAFVTYGLPSTRPSPILCKRYFSKLEVLKRDSLEIPELVGLGQISNEESERDGMAMLEGFACALEMFDLLDAAPNSNSIHILRQILHVAAYPPGDARNPAWNVSPDFDHLSWSNLPQELRKRDIHYSSFLIRPLPQLERFHAAVCPCHETSPPWFEVRPHHKCLLWVPADPMDNVKAVVNSKTPPTDFSPQEYQRLIEKYLTLGRENDRLVKAIRSGNQVDIGHVRQVLQTDFPLFARLQDYFSRLRVGNSKSVDRVTFTLEDPASGGSEELLRSVEVNVEGDSESDRDLGAMSMFSSTEASAFVERPPTVPNQGPFGVRFSDFPPRVISQMLSAHTNVTASSSWWRGSFTWAGFEHVSRTKKFMRVPMIGLNVTNGKDLRAHTWPQDMILLPSGTKRVNDAALQEWIKRYDPMWCQFVPYHIKGGNDAVMNDLVYRQLVQRLIDQCLYAVASWDVQNCPGLRSNLLLLPCNSSGLIGAVFSSVGKPVLPTPSGPSSLAGPTSLFESPVQLDILRTELRSFCVFSDPIQMLGNNQYYDEILNRAENSGIGPDSRTSSLGSESNGGQSQTGSPEVCETLEQQQKPAHMQPAVSQLVEPQVYPEVIGVSLQAPPAFDFDFDSGAWVSTEAYTHLPKDHLDWMIQGISFPEPFA